MNRLRLAILGQFLLTVPEEKFNLEHWQCSTTACAVGWACSIPEFQQQGLSIGEPWGDGILIPLFEGEKHFEAAEKFFDISWRDAEWLFMPCQENYSKPIDVAMRIAYLLKLDSYDRINRLNSSFQEEIESERYIVSKKAQAAKA